MHSNHPDVNVTNDVAEDVLPVFENLLDGRIPRIFNQSKSLFHSSIHWYFKTIAFMYWNRRRGRVLLSNAKHEICSQGRKAWFDLLWFYFMFCNMSGIKWRYSLQTPQLCTRTTSQLGWSPTRIRDPKTFSTSEPSEVHQFMVLW